jgi:hypothetical protein
MHELAGQPTKADQLNLLETILYKLCNYAHDLPLAREKRRVFFFLP